ncbi:AAA family ATPase [Nocardia salmonicida]|uniref:AAA family ATPase n=1 Tax=Nocardia salmonicida TaxID=53431 RepID=UPI0033F9B725
MRFCVLGSSNSNRLRPRTCYLYPNNWDDWFSYETSYRLEYVDAKEFLHVIGYVKIGQFGMGMGRSSNSAPVESSGLRSPELPTRFASLPNGEFFSLGQDPDYYDRLNGLGADVRVEILRALNDIAFDLELYERALKERVTSKSLFRNVPRATATGQFRRMSHGGARLTRYTFTYYPGRETLDSGGEGIGFRIVPESSPPSNIQVIIGRNGIGKTRLLDRMARAIVSSNDPSEDIGYVDFNAEGSDGTEFSRVVAVSFSAFDSVDPIKSASRDKYKFIGLKANPERSDPRKALQKVVTTKSRLALTREFGASVLNCLHGERLERWRRALSHLEADPEFADREISGLADEDMDEDDDLKRDRAREMYKSLSSGHKIVLHMITQLVENVDERSLVLIDEPEAHLHPPLLSAFIRALSDLLINRNGAAVVATHSPVVLQEVPRECAWILHRSGGVTSFSRPRIETFGENVSVLTQEVFGLEVTKSGFHNLLRDAVVAGGNYEEILDRFSNELGGEARSILRGLIATRDRQAR